MRKLERINGKINPCGTLKETEKKIIKLENVYFISIFSLSYFYII